MLSKYWANLVLCEDLATFAEAFPELALDTVRPFTGKYMDAVDIYTGNFLWKIEMPMTQRVQWRYMDGRVYSRPYERNYIATADTLYIIYEREIHRVSAATGEVQGILTIPDAIASAGKESTWTEVRLLEDHLCCVVDDTLACLDRKSYYAFDAGSGSTSTPSVPAAPAIFCPRAA